MYYSTINAIGLTVYQFDVTHRQIDHWNIVGYIFDGLSKST